ncbi:hypothetical protein ACU3L3_19680 [Priestia endophytica]
MKNTKRDTALSFVFLGLLFLGFVQVWHEHQYVLGVGAMLVSFVGICGVWKGINKERQKDILLGIKLFFITIIFCLLHRFVFHFIQSINNDHRFLAAFLSSLLIVFTMDKLVRITYHKLHQKSA